MSPSTPGIPPELHGPAAHQRVPWVDALLTFYAGNDRLEFVSISRDPRSLLSTGAMALIARTSRQVSDV